MKIGIPGEVLEQETRVAVVPSMVSALTKNEHQVFVERGAGIAASFTDAEFEKAGATMTDKPTDLYKSIDTLLKVNPPQKHPKLKKHEIELMPEGSVYIGFLAPLENQKAIKLLQKRKITAFSMEYVPRITRAQSMDALSSMATIAGYKAVLLAASRLTKIFPLLMTAAGTIPASTVLVLGAGVAGLQAIATAKRLGAKVEAFDPRPATKEQVESLAAHFVEMEMPEDAETEGGYAKEMSEEFLKKEQEAIARRLPRVDAVITTAQVFGKKAPILITKEMVETMRPGSVIVDLAAAQGGNCELTDASQDVEHNGVKIIGAANLPATIPSHASLMYSKNIINLFNNIYRDAEKAPDFEDEVTRGACITHDGEIVNESVKNALS
ncbi:Re/Si-specific NAD(P)(+) transhydrogenase subunit alpha [candidate division KSB1 bacterium]|nr:Re/Si-specific NAD(P)(+) transhydrogenase subunit alpha [candidate division KSB1 bacterium]